MAAITTAVVGTAVAIKGQRDAKKARKKAASDQRQAAIESADFLAKQGKLAEADIIEATAKAREKSILAAEEAEAAISPFASMEAYNQAKEQIIGNLPVGGAIADRIRSATDQYVASRPEFAGISNVMKNELSRQGSLAVGAATPQFRNALAAEGAAGLAASQDVGQIRQRSFERLADIAGGEASQRANLLIGQAPQLRQLSTGATEARLLGDISGSNYKAQKAETLAGLAGNLYGKYKAKPDEFGFKRGEDPFDTGNY